MPHPRRLALTFDDAVSNHATFVAPLLTAHGFGATFYVTEFVGEGADRFDTDKHQYMTWEQIRGLHDLGFEVGNHTGTHRVLTGLSDAALREEVEAIEERCLAHGIPFPRTFCYPVGIEDDRAVPLLREKGYRLARSCGDRPYRPTQDDPFRVPSFVIKGNNPAPFHAALKQGAETDTIVLTLHGVPDYNHPWVDTPPELFRHYLETLAAGGWEVVSLAALAPSA